MRKSEKYTSSKMTSANEKLLAENDQINVQKTIKMVPPDGGWGWIIVIGSFVGVVLGTFPLFSFGILFSPILMSHGVSSTKIAWIYNTQNLIWSTYILFIGPLCDEFGWRKVAIFGGVANFISVFLSAFSPNPDFLFFSFSVLGGIGGSTGLSLSFLIVPTYFVKHRGFAVGITTIGSCASAFLAPIVANYLLEHYDYTGASLIFAAIVLNQCVGGSLYHPVEWHMKPAKMNPTTDNILNVEILDKSQKSEDKIHLKINPIKSVQNDRKMSDISIHSADASFIPSNLEALCEKDLKESKACEGKSEFKYESLGAKLINVLKITYNNVKSLKYMRVHFISWAFTGLMLGYINFQMWIPFVITNAGYSLEAAAWCSSLASVGNLTGRIIMSVLSDRKFFNVRYGFMFGLVIIGISIIIFSLVEDIMLYMLSTCFWGFGIGFALSLHITVIISVMGVDMLPAVLGVSAFLKGLGGITIGTLTGVVRDATSTYTYAMMMLAGAELVAFCLWFFMPCAEKFDTNKYKERNEMKKILRNVNFSITESEIN